MTREEKKKANQQRMIDAAVHLFSKKPFTDVSMRDIAKYAEVSPALIYKYFDDQQHLYMEAIKVEGQKLIGKLTPFHQLSELVEQYICYMFKDEVLFQMMAYFMLEANERRPTIPIHNEIAGLMKLFESALKPLFPVDTRREAQLLFSTLNGLLITYKNYSTLTTEQALHRINSLSKLYISHLQTTN